MAVFFPAWPRLPHGLVTHGLVPCAVSSLVRPRPPRGTRPWGHSLCDTMLQSRPPTQNETTRSPQDRHLCGTTAGAASSPARLALARDKTVRPSPARDMVPRPPPYTAWNHEVAARPSFVQYEVSRPVRPRPPRGLVPPCVPAPRMPRHQRGLVPSTVLSSAQPCPLHGTRPWDHPLRRTRPQGHSPTRNETTRAPTEGDTHWGGGRAGCCCSKWASAIAEIGGWGRGCRSGHQFLPGSCICRHVYLIPAWSDVPAGELVLAPFCEQNQGTSFGLIFSSLQRVCYPGNRPNSGGYHTSSLRCYPR